MPGFRALGLTLALAAALLGCTPRPKPESPSELLVFAAASLRDALTEVGTSYEQAPEGVPVRYNFAASNALAQQLIAAPRADVFFSASEAWMDKVEQAGVVAPDTRQALLGNQLVVVVREDSALGVHHACDLLTLHFDHLVLGDPAAVPAGVYAKELLEATECPGRGNAWSALASRVLPMPDVRAALAQVEASGTAVAIVYRTDAASSRHVRVALAVTGEHAPRITYPVALVGDRVGPAQRRFIAHLESPAARAIFERHGFSVLEGDVAQGRP